MKKFTPAPWTPIEDGLIDKMIASNNYELIIDITHLNHKRNNADAYLIASSPDMFNCLKELLKYFKTIKKPTKKQEELLIKIQKIINKARGIKK